MSNTFTDIHARELDFVSRFALNWDALKNILGVMNTIKKQSGTQLVSYTAEATNGLAQSPAAGQVIPATDITVKEAYKEDITVEKYRKNVTIEDVSKYGAEIAIQKTDDAFLIELQNNVMTRFYDFLHTGTLTDAAATWQLAMAMAKGKVIDKFNRINRTVTDVVAFVNVLDVYEYIGTAEITVQTQFGLQYLKGFMGYSTVFLLSEPNVGRGKVYATAVENIDLYHVDPADSDFAKLGLAYTADGVTNLIGFHAEGDYKTATGDSYALMGMTLWAEYIDAIAVITVDDSFLPNLVVQSGAAGSTYPWTDKTPSDFQSDVTVNGDAITGTLKFIEGGLAESGPLAGDGYFLALKWNNPAAGVTSLKVGLVPSASGMEPVECISDTDRSGVFKVSDKQNQRLVLIQSDGTHKNYQYFSLAGLTLEDATGV